VFRNGIPGKETVKGRFAALPAEVCRGKAEGGCQLSVISDQSSVISDPPSALCPPSSVLRRLSVALGLRSMVYHFPGLNPVVACADVKEMCRETG
jgi:hypothetical protein